MLKYQQAENFYVSLTVTPKLTIVLHRTSSDFAIIKRLE
jgi:hypothetical protein